MATRPRKKAKAGYMISAVAELYNLHPQTLRLYERVGLLKPSRSQGNTRLYTDSGKKLRLREKGAPSARRQGHRGDQIVEVQVVVPKPEDEKVRELLRELSKAAPEDPRVDIFSRATL